VPQKLVTEFCGEVAAGRADVVLVTGAEAMSTVRHLRGTPEQPDWTEDPGGSLDDRGYGLRGMVALRALHHGLHEIAGIYAMAENARRAARGEGRDAYAASMGALFEPFTRVAAANPHSVAPEEVSADELVTVTERNRMITAPYTRMMVSRDLVNQGAAVVLTSVATARRLGVDESRWVFLHGHADLREQPLWERLDLAVAPSQADAVRAALAMAGTTLDDVRWIDLYSCFPVAVSQLADQLGLAPDDPRGLTVTGGLPFFGGPGNNYSMHAIAEIVERARREPGTVGMLSANGGTMSKVSVGVYSTTPAPWRPGDDAHLQAVVDARPTVVLDDHPADGWASVETWTVRHGKRGRTATVVGRTADDRRFLATSAPGDDELADWLEGAGQPVGEHVFVRNNGSTNHVSLTRERMDALLPAPPRGWRDSYEHLTVRRDGGVVEVTLAAGDLAAGAHVELDAVLDAFEADRSTHVAVVVADGLAGAADALPRSGWAGLTSRSLSKPVVLALAGDAVGGGAEALLAASMVVLAEDAGLAFDQVVAGRLAEHGGLVRLPRVLTPALATELLLTGRRVDAAEAGRLGLVNRVVPATEVTTTARDLAATVAAVPSLAVRLSLEVLADAAGEPDTFEAARRPRVAYDDVVIGE
jgi:acetyl-CoA C-acetyltransferase